MKAYDPRSYPPVAVTVDLVLLTIQHEQLHALVIKRAEAPFGGHWALPRGFVRPDEDLAMAAERELNEETSLPGDVVHLEQLATYGAPDRDPRMRVVTVAYLALAPNLPVPVAGGDAAKAMWAPVKDLLEALERLAFDHHRILRDGLERARAKLEYSTLGTAFCQPEFTVAELRRVYEIVWGTPLDPRNFHRKVTGAPGFLTAIGQTTMRDGGRPAQLYRRGQVSILYPPILRKEPNSQPAPHP